jgi:hypothetical protein
MIGMSPMLPRPAREGSGRVPVSGGTAEVAQVRPCCGRDRLRYGLGYVAKGPSTGDSGRDPEGST